MTGSKTEASFGTSSTEVKEWRIRQKLSGVISKTQITRLFGRKRFSGL